MRCGLICGGQGRGHSRGDLCENAANFNLVQRSVISFAEVDFDFPVAGGLHSGSISQRAFNLRHESDLSMNRV